VYILVNLFLPNLVLEYSEGYNVTDDRPLVERAKRGDMDAFRRLVESSMTKVYWIAYDLTGSRRDAEDLSQDVFLKAFHSLDSFRGDAKWSTWLYRITVNTCLDYLKSPARKRMQLDNPTSDDGLPRNVDFHEPLTPDRITESRMIQVNIERALDSLSPQERSVFVLRHYHDLPLKQIADTLSVAEGTVKSHLFRAIHSLQRELGFYRNEFGLEEKP
jgi:RNA polymerase sigma-70 factor (ECF subfamily)